MRGISAFNVTDNVSLFCIEGLPTDGSLMAVLLNKLAQKDINIDMISQSTPMSHGVTLSFTLADKDMAQALLVCKSIDVDGCPIKPLVSSSNCKLQFYGTEMADCPGVAAKVISAVCNSGAEVQLITTSEIDISCLIPRASSDHTVEVLKEMLML